MYLTLLLGCLLQRSDIVAEVSDELLELHQGDWVSDALQQLWGNQADQGPSDSIQFMCCLKDLIKIAGCAIAKGLQAP